MVAAKIENFGVLATEFAAIVPVVSFGARLFHGQAVHRATVPILATVARVSEQSGAGTSEASWLRTARVG